MTHGLPHTILDKYPGGNVGCDNVLRAVGRAKPLMHCFGHTVVTWKEYGTVKNQNEQKNAYPATDSWPIKRREQTLMVNKKYSMSPDNDPFIVALDLPRQ